MAVERYHSIILYHLWFVFQILGHVNGAFLSPQRMCCHENEKSLTSHRLPPLFASDAVSDAEREARNRVRDDINRRAYLELKWNYLAMADECDLEDMNTCGGQCDACDGEGARECRFCGGTGFFTLGNTMYGKGQDCLICGGEGEESCKECKGSGWIARWKLASNKYNLLP